MLPYTHTILKYYQPGTIENYDDIIEFDKFYDLFPQIDMPSEIQLKHEIKEAGFDNSKIDNCYFVLVTVC